MNTWVFARGREMIIVKWYREIQKVGLVDWVWFVVWMQRDEFHRRLDLTVDNYRKPEQLTYQRNRAHRIDMAISEIQ